MDPRPIQTRHWLAAQLDHLDALARERDRVAAGGEDGRARAARDEFLRALDAFAIDVCDRPEVEACVVGHEGLPLASAGRPPDAETLAAVSQVWSSVATKGATQLALGPMTQLVVIGEVFKVALFQSGGMTIAILARSGVDLAGALAG
ncbi:MAG: roadblock/LC7 domain-containing protein [Myxococcota bacterium]